MARAARVVDNAGVVFNVITIKIVVAGVVRTVATARVIRDGVVRQFWQPT